MVPPGHLLVPTASQAIRAASRCLSRPALALVPWYLVPSVATQAAAVRYAAAQSGGTAKGNKEKKEKKKKPKTFRTYNLEGVEQWTLCDALR